MKRCSLINKFILTLLLVTNVGCANSFQEYDELVSSIENDLQQGKTVIIYQMQNKERHSEQYADWSSALNDFVSTKTNEYAVYKSTKLVNSKYLKNQAKYTGNYTLFIKKDEPIYFYEGVIVELMVYMAVNQAYSGGTMLPMYEAFLPDELALPLK